MKCWAEIIGGCGGGISGEHYISNGIFDEDKITVSGFPWCKEPREIGLASAVANILCKNHNSALSDCDNEAIRLRRFLTLNIHEQPLADDSINLSGILFEKWALKTLINLGYLGALDQINYSKYAAPEEIANYIFNSVDVKDGIGLYFVSGGVNSNQPSSSVSWNAINNTNTEKVVGMTFTINGLRFIASAVARRAEVLMKPIGEIHGVDYSKAKIEYRPMQIVFKSKTAGEKIINFKWGSN